MDQQHVARQARGRQDPLLEVEQHVGRLVLVQLAHVGREGDLVLELHRSEGAAGLRRGLNHQAPGVAAAVTGDVVPQDLDAVLGNREGVVMAIGEIRQAVAAVHRLGIDGALPGRVVDGLGRGGAAVAGVDRDLVGAGVALEHRHLPGGELVLVLLGVGRGDGEQRLLAGVGIADKAVGVDHGGVGRQATGPGRNAAVGVTELLRAQRGEVGAELRGLFLGDGGHDVGGQQAEGQHAALQESSLGHSWSPCGQKLRPKLRATKSRSVVGL
ncbi:hypothetical protein D9M71_463250 [compost metagenome]